MVQTVKSFTFVVSSVLAWSYFLPTQVAGQSLCRCEAGFENLYDGTSARKLGDGNMYPYDYTQVEKRDGYYYVEGVRVLPPSSSACSSTGASRKLVRANTRSMIAKAEGGDNVERTAHVVHTNAHPRGQRRRVLKGGKKSSETSFGKFGSPPAPSFESTQVQESFGGGKSANSNVKGKKGNTVGTRLPALNCFYYPGFSSDPGAPQRANVVDSSSVDGNAAETCFRLPIVFACPTTPPSSPQSGETRSPESMTQPQLTPAPVPKPTRAPVPKPTPPPVQKTTAPIAVPTPSPLVPTTPAPVPPPTSRPNKKTPTPIVVTPAPIVVTPAPFPSTVSTPKPASTPKPHSSGSSKAITTTQDLLNAVDRWMNGENSADTELATLYGYPIGKWDVSQITDFSSLFYVTRNANAAKFKDDISEWDVSSATSMESMFNGAAAFNGDLSKWDVSSVLDMRNMFNGATSFNGNISTWDVSNVVYMTSLFYGAAAFNGDLSKWDVSSVTTMDSMFYAATSFNGDLSNWDVSSVTTTSEMFYSATSFRGVDGMSNWNLTSVTSIYAMFQYASYFNKNFCKWGEVLQDHSVYTVSTFSSTSCPTGADPNLFADPPGPFCYPCS